MPRVVFITLPRTSYVILNRGFYIAYTKCIDGRFRPMRFTATRELQVCVEHACNLSLC
jgi:hypothetical protein